jgi:hypothetical protein
VSRLDNDLDGGCLYELTGEESSPLVKCDAKEEELTGCEVEPRSRFVPLAESRNSYHRLEA